MKKNWVIAGQTWELNQPVPNQAAHLRVDLPGGVSVLRTPLPSGGFSQVRCFGHRRGTRLDVFLSMPQRPPGACAPVTWTFGGEVHIQETNSSALPQSQAPSSQFPGKVRKVFFKAGDEVPPGAVVLLLEAMKMEFPIKAALGGRLRGVLVAEGDAVLPGHVLFEFESSGSPGAAKS